MGFADAVENSLRRYATFPGRAPRSEYRYFHLSYAVGSAATLIVTVLLATLLSASNADPANGTGTLVLALGHLSLVLLDLALLLPSLAVSCRRLHDTGRTGWWYLLAFVPIGSIVPLVLSRLDSAPAHNQWGPHPEDTRAHPRTS